MAIEIKVLQSGDEAILMNVAADVFDNPIDAEITKESPTHHIAIAIDWLRLPSRKDWIARAFAQVELGC